MRPLRTPLRPDGAIPHVGLLTDCHFGNESLYFRQQLAVREMDALGLDWLVLMGDNVETSDPRHYAVARDVLAGLRAPWTAITGNHELFPHDLPVERCLDRFRSGFGQDGWYQARRLGAYLFVLLGIDQRDPTLPRTLRDTGISARQLAWLRETLVHHATVPTIVISHAPLVDTVADSDHFPLAPSAALQALIADQPQVCLWLSGHTHLPDCHRGTRLQTVVAMSPTLTCLHVPPVADYYIKVVDGVRQFFRTTSFQTRYLVCRPDRILVQTIDLNSGQTIPFAEVVPAYEAFGRAA